MTGLKTYAAICIFCCLWASGLASSSSASFELHKGFIILTAEVEGQEGEFILDSGAPGLVLNARHISTSGEDVAMVGAGGGFTGKRISDQDFAWQNFKASDLEAYCIDISYIEASLGRKILGLVGLDLFDGHDILIDYETNQLHLNHRVPTRTLYTEVATFPLYSEDHVMSVGIAYANKEMRFILDTGSRPNIIHEPLVGTIADDDKTVIGKIMVTGSDQRDVISDEIIVRNLKAFQTSLDPTEMVAQDLTALRDLTGVQIDGVLGHAFFKGSKIWINSERTEMVVARMNLTLVAN